MLLKKNMRKCYNHLARKAQNTKKSKKKLQFSHQSQPINLFAISCYSEKSQQTNREEKNQQQFFFLIFFL